MVNVECRTEEKSVIIASCCLSGCHGYSDELVRFVEQARQLGRNASVNFQMWKLSDVAEHFEPEVGFVRLDGPQASR